MSLSRAGIVCAQLDDTDVQRLARYAETTRMTVNEAASIIMKTFLHRWDEAVQGHEIPPIVFPEKRQ